MTPDTSRDPSATERRPDRLAFEALLAELPGLDDLLRAEDIHRAPDAWLAVHRCLHALESEGRWPDDPLQLGRWLGPLLCKSPTEQAAFGRVFEQWLTGAAPNPKVRLDSPAQTVASRWRERIRCFDRRARWVLTCAGIALVGLISILTFWPPSQPEQPPTQTTNQSKKPELPTDSKPTTSDNASIPIDDRAIPNRLPLPTPPEWTARIAAYHDGLLAVPWVGLGGWLLWRYRRRRVLRREAPDGETLLNRLRFDAGSSALFSSPGSERALLDLKASDWISTRRLDVRATVAATARRGGWFAPHYRNRRARPEYLLLVRSYHRDDHGAGLADQLARRFEAAGIDLHHFRFRDDPRRLIPWNNGQRRTMSLQQLMERYGRARLIVVCDFEPLFHPLTGQPRPWVAKLEHWSKRVWLNAGEGDPQVADWLWRQRYLLLPLAATSLERLGHWLETWRPRAPEATDDQVGLPPGIAANAESWLEPPPDADLAGLCNDLEAYLGDRGLLLLQALAVYPEPYWNLSQALDFLLFPEAAPGERENRWVRLCRLPWLRHAFLPDSLRETLLRRLPESGQRELRKVYATLLNHLTDADTGNLLELPIAVPGKRPLRRLLRDLFRRRQGGAFDDPIFAAVLLGKRLGFLDFGLPRAAARILPGMRWTIDAIPMLAGLCLVIAVSMAGEEIWMRWGEESLLVHYAQQTRAINRDWTVEIADIKETEGLASAVADGLRAERFQIGPRDAKLTPDGHGLNTIIYPRGAEAMAERISGLLRHSTYGAKPEMQASESVAPNHISLKLARTYQTGSAFRETFVLRKIMGKSRALLIGIGSYSSKDFNTLRGPANDLNSFHRMLKTTMGFEEKEIKELRDEQATKHAILAAIDEWLIGGTENGDRIVLYFTGLGSTLKDHPSILAFDAQKSGENWILDTEIKEKIGRFQNRKLLAVFDGSELGNMLPDNHPAGPMVAYYAAAPRQMTYEAISKKGRSHSAFGLAFIDGIEGRADTNRDGLISYLELLEYTRFRAFEYCRVYLSPCEQAATPQLETISVKQDEDLRTFSGFLVPGSPTGKPSRFSYRAWMPTYILDYDDKKGTKGSVAKIVDALVKSATAGIHKAPKAGTGQPIERLVAMDLDFATGSALLTERAKNALRPVVEAMKSLPDQTFDIEGHTSRKGDYQYNLNLSRKRAESVRQFLINQGVPGTRLTATGLGESVLINPSNPEDPLNNRITIRTHLRGQEALPEPSPNTCMDIDDRLAPAMVVIPPGRFRMGTPKAEAGRLQDEGPRHEVTIPRPMAVSGCEVTVGQFRRFVAETGYVTGAENPESQGCFTWNLKLQRWESRNGLTWRNPGFAQDERHPVVCVNQADAQAYLDWLSERTGAVYRLPTEAEWEYATRAGAETPRYWQEDSAGKAACAYANGADAGSQALGYPWPLAKCDDQAVYTAPVASYGPNAFGLYDTLGNVWEWTADCWYDSYDGAPSDGSEWRVGNCTRRVARGGSWRNEARFLRSGSRIRVKSGEAASDLGFRLARDL